MGAYDQYIVKNPAMGMENDPNYIREQQQRQAMIQEGLARGSFSQDQLNTLIAQGDINTAQLGNMADYNKQAAERRAADLQAQIDQYELDKKRGFDSNGKPIQKDFETIANPDGTLKDPYVLKPWENVQANTDAMSQLRNVALRDPSQASQWAQLAKQQAGLQTQQALDNQSRGAMGALSQARSQLAQNGGLSGGARERLAKSSFRDNLLAKQGINQQGVMTQLGISSQDEQNRIGALQQLQGMENQQADLKFKNQQAGATRDQYNIQNSLNEQLQKRAYEANKFGTGMQAWAAGKSADAQAGAARGGKK